MFVSFAALGLVACAGADQTPTGPVEPIEPSGSQTEIAQVQEALDNSPACSTSAPEVIILRNGGTSSPDSYPGETCTAAETIDLKNYLPAGQVCQTSGATVAVIWDAAVPTTQSACQSARVIVYAWDTTTSPIVFLGSVQSFGIWTTSCAAPGININTTGIGPLQTGHSYRFAISARATASPADTRRVAFRAL
jgi:hypothetical protein